jgi:hypothetical protein
LFEKLNVKNTTGIVAKCIKPVDVPLPVPEALKA